MTRSIREIAQYLADAADGYPPNATQVFNDYAAYANDVGTEEYDAFVADCDGREQYIIEDLQCLLDENATQA